MADATDWSVPFTASYRFVRVSRKTMEEIGEVDGIKNGGTIERNRDTSIKTSASFECMKDLNLGPDFLRVYMDCDFHGKQDDATVCMGTFLVSQPTKSHRSGSYDMDITCYSVLQVLADWQFEGYYSVPSGTNPVLAAAQIVTDCGLNVYAESNSSKLTKTRTYGAVDEETDGTKLEAVNDLLDCAGFSSADVDPYGTVLLKTYQIPSERPQSYTFEEGENARFLLDMEETEDKFSISNCVKVVWSSEEKTLVGVARDDSPASQYSTVNVGREIWRLDRWEKDAEVTQEDVDKRAATLLKTENNARRKVTLEHIYAPIDLTQIVALKCPSNGIDARFFVRTMTYDLSRGGCLTQTNLKSFNEYTTREDEEDTDYA